MNYQTKGVGILYSIGVLVPVCVSPGCGCGLCVLFFMCVSSGC